MNGEDRYVVIFPDEKKAQALQTLGRWASNPELNFTWYNAAIMSQKVRELVDGCDAGK